MAAGVTRLADVVVPEIFTGYVQQLTEEKTRLINAGVLVRDPSLDQFLAGGGLTFNAPSFRDLDSDEENVSSDDPGVNSSPNKIQTSHEIAVRLSRNNSWSSMDLTQALAGADPMMAIADRVSTYWARRLQAAFVAMMRGIFANNAKATPGGTGVQNDMVNDVSGGAFVDGVTNFTAEAFLDAAVTMGDSMDDLGAVFVHSVVYNRMQKNNLIDFIPDARGETNIPTFLGRVVVVDDSMPFSNGVFDTWLFGSGATRLGTGNPKVPTEVEREASAGNGGGQELLFNRVEWTLHAAGHAYDGTAPDGGPSNAATANNLAHEDSFIRVFPERKQIKIARLVTRES